MLGLNTSPFPLNWIEEEDEEERKWEKKKIVRVHLVAEKVKEHNWNKLIPMGSPQWGILWADELKSSAWFSFWPFVFSVAKQRTVQKNIEEFIEWDDELKGENDCFDTDKKI